MDSAGDRRPAGCEVPCGCRSAGSCTRDLGHGGAGQKKAGKVAGSHGEVSRAQGEEGTQAGTCRSPGVSGWLRSATPPAGAAGIRRLRAALRPPRRRRGEPGGPRRSVCPSRPAGARRPGAAGGAGRGRPLGRRPIGPSSARRLASGSQSALPGPRARRCAAAGCWLPGSGSATGELLDGQRGGPAGRAPPPRPKCRVTRGAARPGRGGAEERPAPPTCEPSAAGSTLNLWETDDLLCGPSGSGNRLSSQAKPCEFAGIFLVSIAAPNLF